VFKERSCSNNKATEVGRFNRDDTDKADHASLSLSLSPSVCVYDRIRLQFCCNATGSFILTKDNTAINQSIQYETSTTKTYKMNSEIYSMLPEVCVCMCVCVCDCVYDYVCVCVCGIKKGCVFVAIYIHTVVKTNGIPRV